MATPGVEKGAESGEEESFTHFTLSQLRRLQLLVGLATTTSSLTATIYLPLLPLLRTYFQPSAQAVNLTLTIYIVFQAISPVIFGPLSDTYGRRPIFLLVLGIYAVSNKGLAVNEHSFTALATLRALQSLGASATYSIAFGVVADVCLPRDRGRILGPIGMALNLGTCVGPIIGGCVAYFSASYNWAFWALIIAGVMLFSSVGLFLPETTRSLVGNGSDRSRFKWWQISWLSLAQESFTRDTGLQRKQHGAEDTDQEIAFAQSTWINRFLHKHGLIKFYNCFRIIFHKDTFLVLWVHGSVYTIDYSFVAAVPDIFKSIYGWNEWQTGLAYLPQGTGIILGSYFTGKLLDHNYRIGLDKPAEMRIRRRQEGICSIFRSRNQGLEVALLGS